MPKEFRKRGKRSKKDANNVHWKPQDHTQSHDNFEEERHEGPSWVIPGPKKTEDITLEAPFGYLDADVKAYFRTVDVQIRDWQDNEAEVAEGHDDVDPNEERRLFFIAALTEMADKEKQLATDPECSNILERVIYSMDDFARRVFVDRLAGSYDTLVKHRFASHVCQTLFTVVPATIARENKGILPPTSDSFDEGELRTLTELIIAVCEELYPSFASLIMDPFASHVIRALLLLLSPSLHSIHNSTTKSHSIRSKKSAAWKARQAPMKSVFADNRGKGSETPDIERVPKQFRAAAVKFVHILREELDENEVRALAADKVASPVLQMLLEVEADQGLSDKPNSLMDRLLVGAITSHNEDPSAVSKESEFLSTLLRDATSSHLLETLVTRSPEYAFMYLWSTYFQRKLARLTVHPVANFVVARAIERVNTEQFGEACGEITNTLGKIIKSSTTGVLRAMVDRAAVLCNHEDEINEAICTAFDLASSNDRKLLVPCVMVLKPLQQYQSLISAQTQAHDRSENKTQGKKSDGNVNEDPLEPKIQGAVLLQSLLRLHEPHNQLVIDSIMSLSIEDLLKFAHHATSSRVFDAMFESPTVPFKAKRTFVMRIIGHYHLLVDDRIGSRVGDRCWAFADPYLREKIARSLFPHEQFLAGSFYGKFFARNLSLYLLQRKPDEWKNLQSQNKLASLGPTPPDLPTSAEAPVPSSTAEFHKSPKKRKRHAPDNEIDALFDATFSKKVKKGALDASESTSMAKSSHRAGAASPGLKSDEGLREVLGAIRAAPKDEKGGKKKGPR